MSWFRDEEKERAALTKKLQYQEELKAQMRANEEAKKLQKAADRSHAFVHPTALGEKPYAKVSDNSHQVLQSQMNPLSPTRAGSNSPPRRRRSERASDREYGGEDEYSRPAARQPRDRSRGRDSYHAGGDSDFSRGNADFSTKLFRAASRPIASSYDDEDEYAPPPRRRDRDSGVAPLARIDRRQSERDYGSEDYSARSARRGNDRSSVATVVQVHNTKNMHNSVTDEANRAKQEKKLMYQEELKAQMRANEEAKRLIKEADRSGQHVYIKPSNLPSQNALILYNQTRASQQQQAAAAANQRDYPDERDSRRGGGGGGGGGGGYDDRDDSNDRDDYRSRDRYDAFDRVGGGGGGFSDRGSDRDNDRGSAFGMLEGMFKAPSRPSYIDSGYEGGNRGGYDDIPPPPKQVQWAIDSDNDNANYNNNNNNNNNNNVNTYSGNTYANNYGRNNNNNDNRGNHNSNMNYNNGPLSPQPSVAALKSDLRAGPSAEQAARKSETAATYAAELRIQMEANAEKKAREQAKQKAIEEREAAEAASYNPWGKGGSGAPVRDSAGNIITNRKQAVQQAETNINSPPSKPQQQQQLYGNNNGGREQRDRYGGRDRDRDYNDYDRPNTLAPSASQPALSNAGGGEQRFTRFKVSDMHPEEQAKAAAKQSAKDSYQNELAAQVEAKRRKKEEEKRRQEEEDAKEEARIRRQLEEHNAAAEAERGAARKSAMEAEAAGIAAAQAKAAEKAAARMTREAPPAPISGGAAFLDAYASEQPPNGRSRELARQRSAIMDTAGGEDSYRSPRSFRKKKRRGGREENFDDEDGFDVSQEADTLSKIIKTVELATSASQPTLHGAGGRGGYRSHERDMFGATGLPAALLQPRADGAIVAKRLPGVGGVGPGAQQDPYIDQLRKQNQLAQQQLQLAQQALKARGINRPGVGGGEAENEDDDLLRAVGMDSLDIERRRISSRQGRSRPQSSGAASVGGYRPYSAATEAMLGVDENDDALQMLQKFNLGLPQGMTRDKKGQVAIMSSARDGGGRGHLTPSPVARYPPQSSALYPSERSFNFDQSSGLGPLLTFPRSTKFANPLEQSMSAHSHLVFDDQEVVNLFASQSLKTAQGAAAASQQDSAHGSYRPSTGGSLSREPSTFESGGQGNNGDEPFLYGPPSPSVSTRGAPSISMGMDSYVAEQRQLLQDEEAALAANEGFSAVQEENQYDSSQLAPHDYTAPSNPLSQRNSGSGNEVISQSVSERVSARSQAVHIPTIMPQHPVHEDIHQHGHGGMHGGDLAQAGTGHAVVSVAVDEWGNPIEVEPNYEVDNEFARADEPQTNYGSGLTNRTDAGGVSDRPPSQPISAKHRSVSAAAGASIIGSSDGTSQRSRPASRQITSRFAQEAAAAVNQDSRPTSSKREDHPPIPKHSPKSRSKNMMSPTASASPNWKSTKGGGGGLVRHDPTSKTVTTLAGTVLNEGGRASGPSTRRSSLKS